jgi:uncharacterized protein (TIGR02453 family)
VTAETFGGFRPELLEFLADLRANNTREWFEAHRGAYEAYLLRPAREFVVAMGECLPALGEGIHAEPRVRGSIFAINRDTRFSADKTPYKTYLDLWFWQGDGPSRERPGYFFRLTPERLTLGAGMHAFSDHALRRYRQAVLAPVSGEALEQVASRMRAEIGGRTYKRLPAGLPAEHPRADWLRHSGLFASIEQPVPRELYSSQSVPFCLEAYRRMAPLQQWLVAALG